MKCDTKTSFLTFLQDNSVLLNLLIQFDFVVVNIWRVGSYIEPMSLGVHLGNNTAASSSATWPKMKRTQASKPVENLEEYVPRPQTATLERPRILDIALLGKIDMSLTRKGLISISNLVLAPIHKTDTRDTKRNGGSIKEGRGGKTRKYQLARKLTTVRHKTKEHKLKGVTPGEKEDSQEDEESTVSEPIKIKKPSNISKLRIPSIVKQVTTEKRSPSRRNNTVNNNNNEEDEHDQNNSKTCQRPVIIKKGGSGKRLEEVFGGLRTNVPAPCTTCGRPEQPERFHSHPAGSGSRPSTMMRASVELNSPSHSPARRSAATKSSVRKPVAIKFRSGKSNRKTEAIPTESLAAPEMPRTTNEMPPAKKETKAPVTTERPHRAGPRTVMCYLCGREFGTASYPLHEPHCLQRWQRENLQLPPHLQRPLPEKPEKPLSVEEWNKFAWETSQAHLIPCENCGRTFNPDRLEVHQRSCRPGARKVNFPAQRAPEGTDSEAEGKDDNSGGGGGGGGGARGGGSAPRMPPTVPCYLCGRMFGTKSIGIHEPQCLEKWRVENSRLPPHQQRAEPVKPTPGQCSAPAPPAPAPAPAPAPVAPRGPRRRIVQCYLCGREFGTASINIHEEQCLKKWRLENNKLPPHQRRPEPEKPDIKFTATGEVDFQGTMNAIWQTHLDQLVPCGQCGRTFNPDRIEVHERACKGPKR